MKARAPVALAALLAASHVPAPLAQAGGADDGLAPDPREAALLAEHGLHVRREGARLEFFGGPGGEGMVLVDQPCDDDNGDCVEHRLDAVFAASSPRENPVFGVHEAHYEGHSYTLVSWGGTFETGERPLPSPDGRWLVAAASSENHPPDTGLQLFRREQGMVKPVRRIPTAVLTGYSNLEWAGSTCVQFSASIVADGSFGPVEPFALVEDRPEWRLLRGGVCH